MSLLVSAGVLMGLTVGKTVVNDSAMVAGNLSYVLITFVLF